MPKRGLFKSIFGKGRPAENGAPAYRLLSSWDSRFTPFSGNAWDINTVRAAVDAFARNAAKVQPQHIRRMGEAREDVNDYLDGLLQYQPNPYMSAFDFYYKIAAQYKVYNNAFIYPVYDAALGRYTAFYPINANQIELVEYMGEMYVRMRFSTGGVYTCPYTEIIHIRRHYLDNDIFGADNRPLLPVLNTANTFNQSMGKFAELVSIIRGILKVTAPVKEEDLNKRRDDFVRENLRMENNGSGIIVTDAKYDYVPISEKQTPIPTGQLEYIRREVYDYFGVNDAIVQNKATAEQMDSFQQGEINPFYMQLTQAFTNCIFSARERGFGNEILLEVNRLQGETLPNRVTAAKFLTEIGAATLDQILSIFGFPPIGGEEGGRRVQTLNMVNAALADKYQVPDAGADPPPPEEEPT